MNEGRLFLYVQPNGSYSYPTDIEQVTPGLFLFLIGVFEKKGRACMSGRGWPDGKGIKAIQHLTTGLMREEPVATQYASGAAEVPQNIMSLDTRGRIAYPGPRQATLRLPTKR
jgi:hypothetical protein